MKLEITTNRMVTIVIEDSPKMIARKEVQDSDGFWTDYTWYQMSDGTHVFIFGDSDIYGPEDTPDYECDSYEEAADWFAYYDGCYEEDEDEVEYLMGDLEDILDWMHLR